MPYYLIRNKKTHKEVATLFMTISEGEAWEKRHPRYELACGAPVLGYHVNRQKTDEGFRDRLRKIKAEHPLGNVNIENT